MDVEQGLAFQRLESGVQALNRYGVVLIAQMQLAATDADLHLRFEISRIEAQASAAHAQVGAVACRRRRPLRQQDGQGKQCEGGPEERAGKHAGEITAGP
jgi:hypothetical protein